MICCIALRGGNGSLAPDAAQRETQAFMLYYNILHYIVLCYIVSCYQQHTCYINIMYVMLSLPNGDLNLYCQVNARPAAQELVSILIAIITNSYYYQ